MDREAVKIKWILWIFFVFVPMLAQFSLLDSVSYQEHRGELFNWQHPTFSQGIASAEASDLTQIALESYAEIDADYQRMLPEIKLTQIEKQHLKSLYNQDISFLYNAILEFEKHDSLPDRNLQTAVVNVVATDDQLLYDKAHLPPPKIARPKKFQMPQISLADAKFIELQFRHTRWPEYTYLQFREPSLLEKGWHIGPGDEQYVQYDRIITKVASRHNVEPALIKAIITVESFFDHRAESHRGAKGLMQLMPETAQDLGVTDILDPEQNIDAGARYYKWLLNEFKGQHNLALAAYNAGIKRVMTYGGIPPFKETREYVDKVQYYYQKYKVNPNHS